jgi:benzoate-CoA ligase family protein
MNMSDVVLNPPLARGQGADIAIACGDEAVSFAELNERANRAGNAFRALGIEAEDRVLLVVVDRPIFFYAYLGLLKIGAVPCALNLRLSVDDLAYTFADSAAPIVLADEDFRKACEAAVAKMPAAKPRLIVAHGSAPNHPSLSELIDASSPDLTSVKRAPDAPGFWMYSSGTTGKPKGVVHAQRTAFAATAVLGDLMGVSKGDRVFCSSKLFFAFALGHLMFGTLQLGATAVLYPGWPDAAAVADVIDRHRPTIVLSVPTFYRNMLRGGVAAQPAFKQVRYFMSAGEKLPRALFDQWQDQTGRPILDGIGATETCFLSLSNRPDRMKPGTCGLPAPGTEAKLIAEDGTLVTVPDRPGVLWVKLISVANGYWNLDDLSTVVFNDGWYCTNDMFTFDAEGFYEYQGRADDMLKISGQWVSPAEIEEHVLKHPNVSEAAVVGVPNEDGLVRLALFMVAPQVSDRPVFEKELQDALVASLSIYKCPRRVFYVDSMPVTATGKLQRYALRQIALNEDRV